LISGKLVELIYGFKELTFFGLAVAPGLLQFGPRPAKNF